MAKSLCVTEHESTGKSDASRILKKLHWSFHIRTKFWEVLFFGDNTFWCFKHCLARSSWAHVNHCAPSRNCQTKSSWTTVDTCVHRRVEKVKVVVQFRRIGGNTPYRKVSKHRLSSVDHMFMEISTWTISAIYIKICAISRIGAILQAF